jgi:pimeloyl-ACP methyl ester carboxylesterase
MVLFGAFMEPPAAARDGVRNRAKQARFEGMQPIADAVMQAATAGETKQKRLAAAAFVRESLMRQDPEGYAMTCEALAGAHAVDPGRIQCPVLLVAGEEDPVAPPSVAQMMRERLRNGSVTVLSKCGHWMTIERPDECNQALRDFLQRNRP